MTYRPYDQIVSGSLVDSVEYEINNESGGPIAALTPVTIDSNGGMNLIDVSNETDALNAVGVTKASVLNATPGVVVAIGKIENVSGFSLGDKIWVSKTGTLTNVTPEVGVAGFVAGDFIVRVGRISKNKANPLLIDLIIEMSIIGQLS
jgi:hypothetical protein